MENKINVLSLFDGMSCGQIALNNLNIGINNYFASEIDKHAIKVTQNNFPNTIQLGNVKDIDIDKLPEIDLLLGGTPCQNLSRAVIERKKYHTGLEGDKSSLFYEYLRVLEEIDNPNIKFLFENVYSMPKEDKKLIDEALGVKGVMLDSKHFSPQNRKRYYWTNIDFSSTIFKSIYYDTGKLGGILQPAYMVDRLERKGRMNFWYDEEFRHVNSEGKVEAILNINGHDIIKRVYKKDRKAPTLTTVSGGNRQLKVIQRGKVRKLTPIEYERLQTVPVNYTEGVSNTQRYNMLGNGWNIKTIEYILKNL